MQLGRILIGFSRTQERDLKMFSPLAVAALALTYGATARPRSSGNTDSLPPSVLNDAEDVIKALAAGQPDSAERRFSSDLRLQQPPQALLAHWQRIVHDAGAFKRFDNSNAYVRVPPHSSNRIAVVIIDCERRVVEATLTYSVDELITGISFGPANGAESPTPSLPIDPPLLMPKHEQAQRE
jgi:hypothetical protein